MMGNRWPRQSATFMEDLAATLLEAAMVVARRSESRETPRRRGRTKEPVHPDTDQDVR
jgi:hypothetical protein